MSTRGVDKGQKEDRPTISSPNDAVVLPEEIVKKLQARKIIRPKQLEKPLELKSDAILANRSGFIATEKGDKNFAAGESSFSSVE